MIDYLVGAIAVILVLSIVIIPHFFKKTKHNCKGSCHGCSGCKNIVEEMKKASIKR